METFCVNKVSSVYFRKKSVNSGNRAVKSKNSLGRIRSFHQKSPLARAKNKFDPGKKYFCEKEPSS